MPQSSEYCIEISDLEAVPELILSARFEAARAGVVGAKGFQFSIFHRFTGMSHE